MKEKWDGWKGRGKRMEKGDTWKKRRKERRAINGRTGYKAGKGNRRKWNGWETQDTECMTKTNGRKREGRGKKGEDLKGKGGMKVRRKKAG